MVELDEISKRAIANMRRDMAEDIKRDVEMFRKLKMTDDDPNKMLAESWIYYAVFWIAVLSLAFLSACTSGPVICKPGHTERPWSRCQNLFDNT